METNRGGRPRGRTVGPTIPVRLPPEVEEALRRRAEAEDRPLAGLVRQAIRQYLAADLKEAKAS